MKSWSKSHHNITTKWVFNIICWGLPSSSTRTRPPVGILAWKAQRQLARCTETWTAHPVWRRKRQKHKWPPLKGWQGLLRSGKETFELKIKGGEWRWRRPLCWRSRKRSSLWHNESRWRFRPCGHSRHPYHPATLLQEGWHPPER